MLVAKTSGTMSFRPGQTHHGSGLDSDLALRMHFFGVEHHVWAAVRYIWISSS